MKELFTDAFHEFYNGVLALTPRMLLALIIFIFFLLIGRILSKSSLRILESKGNRQIEKRYMAKSIKWIFIVIGLLVALHLIGFGSVANSLIAGAGISAIIVGFAFKDIAENFLSGILLVTNRPFNIGDIIEIENQKGTVKALNMRDTHIRNSAGKDLFIPNALLIKNPLINYTRDGNLRLDFDIGIDPSTNVPEVRELILNYFKGKFNVLRTPGPDVQITDSLESVINMKVLFWINIFDEQNFGRANLGNPIRSRTLIDVIDLLNKNGVNMPSYVIEHKMTQPDTYLNVRAIKET